MKNYISLLSAVVLAATLTACGKDKDSRPTEVSGRILEKGSGRPIENARVYLIENDYRTYNIVEIFMDSLTTGKDGRYSFAFGAGPTRYYKVAAEAPLYYTNNPNGNLDHNIEDGEEQELDIELAAHAWVRLRWLNQSGADYVNVNGLTGGYESSYQIVLKQDTTLIDRGQGNEINELPYFVYKDTNRSVELAKFYLPAHDTTDHQITY